MITNPEYLSKDRLKQELKKRGISFNPNENKDYYIQLFREKIMHGKELDKGRSELSSDDEFVRQSPRAVRKQQKKTSAKTKPTAAKINTFLPQVETLSDKDLTEQLQEYGENVGPITATTRSVYERKLAKLMATGGEVLPHEEGGRDQVDHAAQQESFIGEWSGDESDTTEEESAPPPSQHLHGRKHRDREDIAPPKAVEGVEEARPRQRHKPSSSSKPIRVYRPSPSPQAMSCSNIWSLVCSVILIALMFTIAFLVYEHYTCAEEQNSLILTGWEKAGQFVVYMREMILKEPLPEEPVEATDSTTKESSKSKANAKPKKKKKSKKAKTSDVPK